MAACVEASLLDGSGSSCPPLRHRLNCPSPTASKAPARVYMAGHSHSSLFCCSGSLKSHLQDMYRIKGEVYKRRGSVVSAGKGGGEFPSVENDSGTGLLSVEKSRSSKDVNGVLDYSAIELIRDITRSPSERMSYRNFVDELVERMEMVLRYDNGTSADDYKRRADFFTRINEIFVAQRNSEDQAIESDANPSSAAVAQSPSKNVDSNTEITVSDKSVVDEMEEEVLTLQDLLMERDDGTGAADYNRRAAIFGWSAELVAARNAHSQTTRNPFQLEEQIRKFEDVLVLEKDNGRAASDYSRRAAIFGKNAELLVAASQKRAENKRLRCL